VEALPGQSRLSCRDRQALLQRPLQPLASGGRGSHHPKNRLLLNSRSYKSVAAILKNGTDRTAPPTEEVPILFHANHGTSLRTVRLIHPQLLLHIHYPEFSAKNDQANVGTKEHLARIPFGKS
jgi:hypothetical protein